MPGDYAEALANKRRRFLAADRATGGELCRGISKLTAAQADVVKSQLANVDAKTARTEIERLYDYIEYGEFCRGD